MGHRDYKTTEIYADFAPDPTQGAMWAQRAFGDQAEHGSEADGNVFGGEVRDLSSGPAPPRCR